MPDVMLETKETESDSFVERKMKKIGYDSNYQWKI